ncbi:MAG: hypothetical protein MUO91_03970 [candidate division Zixibacteria bacterium]|nr:hypothetical protein [candidate division Zixibacteria bacterium]
MLDRASLIIRGRSEQTKKRQQTDILLKKAMKGNRQAKLKLYKEFGIRLYSSDEVEKYVQERVAQEYTLDGKSANNGPTLLTLKKESRSLSKNGNESRLRRDRNTGSPPRAKSREKTKHLVKKV